MLRPPTWAIFLLSLLQLSNGMSFSDNKSPIKQGSSYDVNFGTWLSVSVDSMSLKIKESGGCRFLGPSKVKIELINTKCKVNKQIEGKKSCSGSCSVSPNSVYSCDEPSAWILRFGNVNGTPSCEFKSFEVTINFKCASTKGVEADQCKLKLTSNNPPATIEAGQNFTYGLSIPSQYRSGSGSNKLDISLAGTTADPLFVDPAVGIQTTSSSGGIDFKVSYPTAGSQEVCLYFSGQGVKQISLLNFEKCKTVDVTAVPTLVPTPAPPTLVPTAVPTIAPTAVPTAIPTAVPTAIPTNIPTAVPTAVPTAAPPTAIPTEAPPTLVPTAIPVGSYLTMTPLVEKTVVLPQKVYDEQLDLASTIISLAAASGSLPAAGTVIASSQPCNMTNKDEKLPFPFHPTRMKILNSMAAGAIVGNLLIVGAFTLISRFMLYLFSSNCIPLSIIPPRLFEGFSDVQGLLRFPSAPLFLFLGLYQGTFIAALMLIQSPPSDSIKYFWIAVGVVTVVLCISVPVVIFREVKKGVPSHAVYYMDNRKCSGIKEYFIGSGEWVSVGRSNHWINRWASVAREFTEEYSYFSSIQFCMSGLVAIAASVSVSGSYCAAIKLIESMVFLAVFAVCFTLDPYARMADNHIVGAAYLIQSTSLMCSAVYYLNEQDPFIYAARVQNYVVYSLITLKIFQSIVAHIYVFVTKRRERLQESYWYSKYTVLEPLKNEVLLYTEPDDIPISGQRRSFKDHSVLSMRTSISEHISPLALSHISSTENDPDFFSL